MLNFDPHNAREDLLGFEDNDEGGLARLRLAIKYKQKKVSRLLKYFTRRLYNFGITVFPNVTSPTLVCGPPFGPTVSVGYVVRRSSRLSSEVYSGKML